MRKFLLMCMMVFGLSCISLALANDLEMGVGQPNIFADAKQTGVTYTSSNSSIATVNAQSGYLSALRPGQCVISATKNGKTVYSLNLTVLKAPTLITVSEKSIEMMIDSYCDLPSFHAQTGEYDRKFEVRSSGSAVSVEGNKLYARDIGTATVYIRAYNGVYTNFEVKVRIKPTEISLNKHSIHLGIGEETRISTSLQPMYSYSKIKWKITGTDVVEFDENSLRIKAIAHGEATITAVTENGLKDSVKISVLPLPDKLLTPKTISTGEGNSGKMRSVLPKGTFAYQTYESLTPKTIKVSSDGTWTALKSGEGTVRIYAEGTSLYTDQSFIIAPKPTSIEILCETKQMYVGQKIECTVKLLPEGSYSTITWTSSNPGCVSVDANGTMTASAIGSSMITASTASGVTQSITVTVLKSPQEIVLNKQYLEMNVGETATLSCAFPNDTLTTLKYTSLDSRIATVDAKKGTVKAVAPGSTAIIVTTSNGLSANCLVTVMYDEISEEIDFEVIFMDVDSNDSIILRSGDEYAFIDSGNHLYGEKAVAFLQELGINHLKYYIGTHAHLDHIGGACVILDNLDVDLVIVPHYMVIRAINGCVWTESEREAAGKAHYCIISHGQTLYLGNVPFKCIGPINIRSVDTKDNAENTNSLVLRADAGEVSLLLTGDGTIPEFNDILRLYRAEVDVDVFKNTHHSGELTDEQIEAISPRITVFSTSSLHLPQDRYLNLLMSLGSEIYMTPTRVNGNITLYTDGKTITVTPQYEDNRANWYNEITGKPIS